MILRKLLWHYGVRYRNNYKKLIGKPDIAITKYKIAVFIDGEFWHGHHWAKHKAILEFVSVFQIQNAIICPTKSRQTTNYKKI